MLFFKDKMIGTQLIVEENSHLLESSQESIWLHNKFSGVLSMSCRSLDQKTKTGKSLKTQIEHLVVIGASY